MQMRLLDKSQDRRYFTIIPNLLWVSELGLRPTDFKLYATIKKVAGETGECFMNTRNLAKEAGISVGATSEGKSRLEAAGLIIIVAKPRRRGGQPIDHITIVDIWQRNVEYFMSQEKCSPDEHSSESVHQVNTSAVECSPDEHQCSPGEPEEEPLNKNQKMNKIASFPDFSSGSAREIWDQALKELELQMTKPTFDSWLKNSRGVSLDDHILTVGVGNKYAVDWCTNRLKSIVEQAVIGVVGERVEVKFEVMK
jgi:hypothetical protein